MIMTPVLILMMIISITIANLCSKTLVLIENIKMNVVEVTFLEARVEVQRGGGGGLNNQIVQINNSQFQTRVCRSKHTHKCYY